MGRLEPVFVVFLAVVVCRIVVLTVVERSVVVFGVVAVFRVVVLTVVEPSVVVFRVVGIVVADPIVVFLFVIVEQVGTAGKAGDNAASCDSRQLTSAEGAFGHAAVRLSIRDK